MDSPTDIIEKAENEAPIFSPSKKVKRNEKTILGIEDDKICYVNYNGKPINIIITGEGFYISGDDNYSKIELKDVVLKTFNNKSYKDEEKIREQIEEQICIAISKKYELEAKFTDLKAKVPDYTGDKRLKIMKWKNMKYKVENIIKNQCTCSLKLKKVAIKKNSFVDNELIAFPCWELNSDIKTINN